MAGWPLVAAKQADRRLEEQGWLARGQLALGVDQSYLSYAIAAKPVPRRQPRECRGIGHGFSPVPQLTRTPGGRIHRDAIRQSF